MPPEASPAVRIEPENEWAWCGARRLRLTPRAFAVLRHLVEHRGRLVTKQELLAAVWRDAVVSDAALASGIRDLRRALGDSSAAPRYIQTVHRRGFRFIGPLVSTSAAAPAPAAATTSTLVGRVAELGRLRARLDGALGGQRQLVFVTGEPGIGKTALVEVFLQEVGDASALRVGCGQCVEQYGAGEAYLPLLEALGRLGRAAGAEPLVRTLKQHAPTWLEQLPGLRGDPEAEAAQHRLPAMTRGRMLRELVDALDALARETPLVLFLEDLHWSDSGTIELLDMLARRREASRLLVLGTYRPADAAAGGHPLQRVKQELQAHGYCDEIPLQFLSVASVDEYLSRRFPGHDLPPDLAAVLHGSTEGNPLFLVNTIDDLIGQGQLREVDGRWRLAGRAEDLAARAPQTLWQLVERQVERLTAEEQAILVAASVAGAEFSAAVLVAAGIDAQHGEQHCEALARRGQFLRSAGAAAWPDGTVAGRYAFIHVLYQQVLYARLSIGARVGLHLRTAERLERGYGERAGEIAGELAVHFEHGRDLERAARYRSQAGEHALHQHAYREAADHARRGLQSVVTSPESPSRAGRELALQVTLGAALTATEGYGATEVARTYARAWELCAQVGETPQLLPVLRGVGRYYVVRGEFQTAREVGAQLLTLAETTREPALLLMAHSALGIVSLYAGDLEVALDHLERGITLYDPTEHHPVRAPLFRLVPPGVTCAIHAAWTLWLLGYPERAAARSRQALAMARALGHPFGVSYACHLAAALHQWQGERQIGQELEDEALAHDTEHGFGLLLTTGVIQRGWLLAERGQPEEGLARMQEGLARHRAIGSAVLVPAFLALVARVSQNLGRSTAALAAVSDGLATAQQSGRHYWEAELHRLSGVLRLEAEGGAGPGASPSTTSAAESHFLRAIEIARRQRARSLELRGAMSLGRLWAVTGRAPEAYALLSGVHAWFTEGLDSADLVEARSLLEELRAAAAVSGRPRADAPRSRSAARDTRPGRARSADRMRRARQPR